jgi:hypothetical protein
MQGNSCSSRHIQLAYTRQAQFKQEGSIIGHLGCAVEF